MQYTYNQNNDGDVPDGIGDVHFPADIGNADRHNEHEYNTALR